MRLLLANHRLYTDHTSGAAKSVRTLVEWMAAAGHECRVLGSARFDAGDVEDIDAHLAALGVPVSRAEAPVPGGCPAVRLELAGIPVEMLLTRHNDPTAPDRAEYAQFVLHFDRLVASFRPDLVLGSGPHPVVQEVLRRARAYGATTLYRIASYGYENPHYVRHADHVLFSGDHLARHYRQAAGIEGTGLPSPIDWGEALAAEHQRLFLTFVHPIVRKGVFAFGRLADMLVRRRPDIPILIVQSVRDAGLLAGIPGVDFSNAPQVVASPAARRPADIFELARVLLVPSVLAEPTGRVAAEAMINGVPPIVSDRGGLPDTVADGGIVLPLPAHITPEAAVVPSEDEMAPWFDAVCRLWDDEAAYEAACTRARAAAERLYGDGLRRRYVDYLASLPGERKPGAEAGLDGPPGPFDAFPG